MLRTTMADDLLLALDTASPVVSIALGDAEGLCAQRTLPLRRSSEGLLRAIDEVLREAGSTSTDLGGLVALRGPGSFTGLRVGLATALGLHQATGVRATTLDTLSVLAAAAEHGRAGGNEKPLAAGDEVVAAVDALRGEWMAGRFRLGGIPTSTDPSAPVALEPPSLVATADLAHTCPAGLVAFDVERLAGLVPAGTRLVPAPPLAPVALRLARDPELDWDPSGLTRAVYFRPPATGRPG